MMDRPLAASPDLADVACVVVEAGRHAAVIDATPRAPRRPVTPTSASPASARRSSTSTPGQGP